MIQEVKVEVPTIQEARKERALNRETSPSRSLNPEARVRDLFAKGLPMLATTALAASYPMGFVPRLEPSRDHRVASQVVISQLLYTNNLQVLAFLVMEPTQIMKLGLRAFANLGRAEAPKMVVSANGEALNTVMSKLGYLVGKLDDDSEATITPPLILNCSGENGIFLRGCESLFLSLAIVDVSMSLLVSLHSL